MKKQKITDTISVAEMLHMRNVEGMSNAEIAKRIGCSVSAVISHIGKQPASMTRANYERWQKNRKAKKEEPSTPVGEPTKPHESFADLVARVKAEAAIEKNKKELGIEEEPEEQAKPEPEVMKAVVLEEKTDNQAKPEPLTAPTTTPYTTYKEQTEKPASHIHELLAIFGAGAVRDYLRVALYVNGNVHIGYMEHDELLSALKTLNGEVATHD